MKNYHLSRSIKLLYTPLLFSLPLSAEVSDEASLLEIIEVVAEKNNHNYYTNNKTVDNISEFLALNIDKIEAK